MLRFSRAHDAPVTRESEEAFGWLKRHVTRDDSIVIDVNGLGVTTDDALWMYAKQGLRPLFGVMRQPGYSAAPGAARRDVRDRLYLLRHLRDLGRDSRTDALARKYHARWVYFDERVVFPFRHTLTLSGLRRNPHLREVFRRGPVHVFEVTP